MEKLYIHTEEYHNLKSPNVIVPILLGQILPKSVLDVGCGIGTWLKIFNESGVEDYLGIDGEYVDRKMLKIPLDKFQAIDLRTNWNLNRKFDLVISLEVAEHLPAKCADDFVESLTNHGETILFSAAIPGQGGQHHINEQPPAYWQSKFERHGFFFHDTIRPLIWENEKIQWWYKQNIFLLKRQPPNRKALFTIHPELFNANLEYHKKLLDGEYGIRSGLDILIKAFKQKFSRRSF
jgi:SAM-dependent methyltransferase